MELTEEPHGRELQERQQNINHQGFAKKQRVSFAHATVATRTFDPEGNDPKEMSSPNTRDLSPMIDASMLGKENQLDMPPQTSDDESVATNIPGFKDTCSTPTRQPYGFLKKGGGRTPPQSHDAGGTPPVARRTLSAGSQAMNISTPGSTNSTLQGEITITKQHDLKHLVARDEAEGLDSVDDGFSGEPQPAAASAINYAQWRQDAHATARPSIAYAASPEALNDTANLWGTEGQDQPKPKYLPGPSRMEPQSPNLSGSLDGHSSWYNRSTLSQSPTFDFGCLAKKNEEYRQIKGDEFTGGRDYEAAPEGRASFGTKMPMTRRYQGAQACMPALPENQSSFQKYNVASAGSLLPRRVVPSSSSSSRPGGAEQQSLFPRPLPMPTGSAASRAPERQCELKCETELKPVPLQPGAQVRDLIHASSTQAPVVRAPHSGVQMPWEEFLERVGIEFTNAPKIGEMTSVPDAGPPHASPHIMGVMENLDKNRINNYRDIVKEQRRTRSALEQEYRDCVHKWNSATRTFPVVADLQHAMKNDLELNDLKQSVADWHEFWKNKAWINHYKLKRDVLENDLALYKHCQQELNQQGVSAQRRDKVRIEEGSGRVKFIIQQAQQWEELQRCRESTRRTASNNEMRKQNDVDQLTQWRDDLKARCDQEMQRYEDVAGKVEGKKREVEDKRRQLREARLRLEERKLDRLGQERERVSRQYHCSEVTDQLAIFSLQGGAKVCVHRDPEPGFASDVRRVSLRLPRPPAATLGCNAEEAARLQGTIDRHDRPLRVLRDALLARLWRTVRAEQARKLQQPPSPVGVDGHGPPPLPELFVAKTDLKFVMEAMGEAAPSVRWQVRSLKEAREACGALYRRELNPVCEWRGMLVSTATGSDDSMRDVDDEDDSCLMHIEADLLFCFSHQIAERGCLLVPVDTENPDDVNLFQCTLLFKADVAEFPEVWPVPEIIQVSDDGKACPEDLQAVVAQACLDVRGDAFPTAFAKLVKAIQESIRW